MEKGRSSDGHRQPRKNLTSPKKGKDSCDECKDHVRNGSFPILLQGTMETLLKKKPGALQEFFKAINALLNSTGGEVIIHLDQGDPDGTTRIDLFDQKVDEKLLKLLPGNYAYHDVYERYFVDSHHLLYRVKPIPRTRFYSTLDFNSRFPVNRGLVEPSHDQMEAFIQNIDKEPTTPRESIVLSELRQHQQPLITKRTTLEPSMPSMQSMESEVEVLETGFHESLSVQAKDIPKQGSRIERCWELSKPYIPAFSKLPNGGCVFLGIREDITVHSKTPKWTEVADASQVTEFNIKFQDGANKGYKIWKEECKDDDPAYYIMKEDQVPKDERKSGRHVVQGIEKAEAAQIETNIKSKVTSDLKWVGVTEPKDVVTVERLPVKDTTLQVIQVNIGFYKGICFDDREGPEVYTVIMSRTGKNEIQRVPCREWLKKHNASHLHEFSSSKE